jgi:flagellar hook-length control protein FliK
MAASDLLLNSLEPAARPAENAQSGAISASDGASLGPLFASLMQEAGGQPVSPDAAGPTLNLPEAGNGLPELPPRSPEFARWQAQPISDAKLEDFAVTIGIDRSLARLLLSRTATDEVAVDQLGEGKDSTKSDSEDSTSAAVKGADGIDSAFILPLLPMPIMSPPMVPAAPIEQPESTVASDVMGITAGVNLSTDALRRSPTMIADEDLMSWRAVGARSPVGASVAETPAALGSPPVPSQPTMPPPLALALALQELRLRPLSGSNGITSDISGSNRLESIKAEVLDSASSAASIMGAVPAKMPSTLSALRTRGLPVAGAEASGGQDKAVAFELHDAPLSASLSAQSILSQSDSAPSLASSDSSTMGLDNKPAGGPAPDLAPTDPAIVATAEGRRPDISHVVRDSVEHLRVLDQRMNFEDRTQSFADAVAQRIMNQVRSENWNVSLQLEPGNLGSMDISLLLRGSELTANVNMSSSEAKAILQAGLPRLQESLESYGLQLAGWSFGQSGSRAQGERSSTPFTAQPYRKQPEEDNLLATPSAVAALQRVKDTSREVDLFV